MLRSTLLFGLTSGLIAATPMSLLLARGDRGGAVSSMFFGYTVMLLALSLVFVGVKRHRDRVLGGVIRFLPALLMGLGISVVAGLVYMIGWEIAQSVTHYAFADAYAAAIVEAARAKGGSPADVARAMDEAAAFKAQYANPLYRMPMTFVEIFPVGVLVSLISALLLRNSRFLPAIKAA